MHDAAAPATGATARGGVLLGVDIGGTSTKLACYDPATGVLRRAQLDTHAPGKTGRPALRRLVAAAKECARLDDGGSLLGLAVVFPGVLHRGRVSMAANAPEFEGMDLHEELAAAFGEVAITLDNDVKAGGLAEHEWGALRGAAHALYLNIGTGLAAAAIIDGEVYRGHHGAALEIGYQLAPPGVSGAAQQPGWRDGVAPMEALFSGSALDALAHRELGPARSAKDVFESARPAIRLELQRRLDAFAAQLVNLSIAFDVERIAIGGGVSRQYARFGEYLVRLLQRLVPFPPALLSARFAYDAPLWGALELARRAAHVPALPDSLFDAPADMAGVSPVPARTSPRTAGRRHDALAPRGKGP